jgi:hypothetical protein
MFPTWVFGDSYSNFISYDVVILGILLFSLSVTVVLLGYVAFSSRKSGKH